MHTCITAVKNDETVYVHIAGTYDSFEGPTPEQYQVTKKVEDASLFAESTGTIDIDLIDAKKYLTGYSWKKTPAPT